MYAFVLLEAQWNIQIYMLKIKHVYSYDSFQQLNDVNLFFKSCNNIYKSSFDCMKELILMVNYV